MNSVPISDQSQQNTYWDLDISDIQFCGNKTNCDCLSPKFLETITVSVLSPDINIDCCCFYYYCILKEICNRKYALINRFLLMLFHLHTSMNDLVHISVTLAVIQHDSVLKICNL